MTILYLGLILLSAQDATGQLTGSVVDAESSQPIAARIYLQGSDGKWWHVETAQADGRAVPYSVSRSPASTETHTAVSAHPFRAELPRGEYELVVERGKEYVPHRSKVTLGAAGARVEVQLQRWIRLNDAGWYSGETHVHRPLDELPTAMLADDLNVALPLTYWVTRAHTAPTQGDKNLPAPRPELIRVDPTHVIWPVNTEYEIFSVGGKRHTLGAIFALNHRRPLEIGVPPVAEVARQVHAAGGLLELDKHNWPWSMMLVPVMQVDLYELTNNHLWRAPFFFQNFGVKPPDYMNAQRTDDGGVTELGWMQFTWHNYYTLLNCGYRLRPTAGTASGVHPVPLGFGRVYVYLPGPFSYEGWIEGLNRGNSFVTTGPLMSVTMEDQLPGYQFKLPPEEGFRGHLRGWVRALTPIERIEVVSAGRVVAIVHPENRELPQGGYDSTVDVVLKTSESTWYALRCITTEAGRPRFAHSAPFHVDIPGQPLRPSQNEVDYLVGRMNAELERNQDVLTKEELKEFEQARDAFQKRAGRIELDGSE